MQKQILILSLLGVVFLTKPGAAFSLDGHHHPHPPNPPPAYSLPPPPPPPPAVPGVPVQPLCGCHERGRCAESLRAFTDLVIRTRASQIVCGSKTELCCYKDDPWPGIIDQFAHLAPCVPDDVCIKHYGISPTDVRDFGAIPPCPGLGSVRCLDGFDIPAPAPPTPIIPPQPEGPAHFVIPIIENPAPAPPPVLYNPPVEVTEPPTTTTETPTTEAPPSTGYDLPEPPVAYLPPQPVEPPAAYLPPQPVEPPAAYLPPQPVEPPAAYLPPQPVEPPAAYLPPQPVEPPAVYLPPQPVEPPAAYLPPQPAPEPVAPSVSYGPPSPVPYYSPPDPEPAPPSPPVLSTSYGVPGFEHGYAYTSRFGYPYGYSRYGGYYPGLRFRLRKYFGVGFLG